MTLSRVYLSAVSFFPFPLSLRILSFLIISFFSGPRRSDCAIHRPITRRPSVLLSRERFDENRYPLAVRNSCRLARTGARSMRRQPASRFLQKLQWIAGVEPARKINYPFEGELLQSGLAAWIRLGTRSAWPDERFANCENI